MRIACFDIGTNTALQIIIESTVPGSYRVVRDIHAIARLGEGVDLTHSISPAAIERFISVMASHRAALDEIGVDRIAAVATSAMRDAENRDEIIALIKQRFDIEIELLSGADEAEWTYRGSLTGVPGLKSGTRIATLDIGGGSTEISIGNGERADFGKSFDVGAVRLTERLKNRAGAKLDSVKALRADLLQQLSSFAEHIGTPQQLVAVAGTPTSLAAMKLGAQTFIADEINGTLISLDDVDRYLEEILSITPAELCRRYPAVNPSRADILPMGTLIFSSVMHALGMAEALVSTRGLRYGIAIRELEKAYSVPPQSWKLLNE